MTDHESNGWSPFVGPRPFKREEEKLFFGRNYESEKIISLIFGHSLVLIYAQSGAGKTSLFNAKVGPALEQKGLQVLPVARVGIGSQSTPTMKNIENTLGRNSNTKSSSLEQINPYLLNAFQSILPNLPYSELIGYRSLAEFLKGKFPHPANQRGKPVPQLLIFDQLEEVFNFYSDPTKWRENQKDFFKQLNEALDSDPLLRIVFIIREDFLAQLDPFAMLVPERLKPRFRLERLRRDAAFDAVKGPLEQAESQMDKAKIRKLFDEGVIDKLIDDLVKIRVETLGGKSQEVKGEFVEPIQLQVVCQRLWEKLKVSSEDEINQSFLGDVDRALQDFYEDSIHEASKTTGIEEGTIRNWFDEKLITSSGTRGSVHKSTTSTGDISNAVVEILENKYIIRKEVRSGAQWYELTHDRLIGPIKDSNNYWKLSETEKEANKAIKEYDKVLEVDPNNVTTWYDKGLLLSSIGRYDEAILSYDKVLEVDERETKYKEALNAKGLALEKLGRLNEAILSYEKVLEIDAKNKDALYNKSNHYYVLGKFQEAEGQSDQSVNSYREAVGGLNKIVGFDSTNQQALELLRELYSNYIFEYNNAMSVDSKLLAINETPFRRLKFAEDLIKVGKNKKGRQLAMEAKKEFHPENIKGQSCARLLVLTSYFLEGNSVKGNEELVDFLRFYEVLENFKVEEKEWNFNGLIKLINSRSINPASKQILINLIDLLRGKGNREKILSKLLSSVSDSGIQLSQKAVAKKIIIIVVALAIVLGTVALYFYTTEVAFAEPCGTPDTTLLSKNMGVPTSIAVNDFTNVAYVAFSNQRTIAAIDCHNRDIVDQVSTPGIVTDLSVDKKTNTLYADTKDANGTMALAIDGGTFGVDGLLEKLVNKYIRKVIPLPEHKDNNNILKINGSTQNAFNFDGNEERTYLLDNNQSTIYVVGDDHAAYPVSSESNTSQDANLFTSHDIAFNPNKNIIYLTNDYNNLTGSISVINATNHNLLKTITGPIESIDSIAFDSKTNKIYITDPFRQIVSVINGSNNKIVKNIPVGAGPRDIFIDDANGMIYVANINSNAVSVINSTKDEVVKIIYLPEEGGKLSSVSADPETKMVYVGLTRDGESGLIQMINSTNSKWSNYIQVGPTLSDLAFNSNTSKIYVAKTLNGSISVIDANNNQTIKDIFLKGESPSKMAINLDTNKIYVSSIDSNKISVIDGKENKLLESISLPFNVSDIAVNPNSNKIYAIGENNENLSIIDGTNDEVVKNETLSFFPIAIEVNPKTSRLYIANYNNWSLTSVDSSNDNVTNGKVINLDIPPQSITVDPITNKVYVSSYVGEDTTPGETNVKPPSLIFPQRTQVQFIDGNNDKVISSKPLKLDPKYGAVILTADPNNGDILAVSLSTDTILSWNMEEVERALVETNGILINVKEVQTGTDPAQVAFNVENGKIYIVNNRLNAILVDELKKYEIHANSLQEISTYD